METFIPDDVKKDKAIDLVSKGLERVGIQDSQAIATTAVNEVVGDGITVWDYVPTLARRVIHESLATTPQQETIDTSLIAPSGPILPE